MAGGVTLKDYIITAEIEYTKNFFRDFDTAIAKIKKLSVFIKDFDFGKAVSPGVESTVKIVIEKNFDEPNVLLAANVLEDWKEAVFESGKLLEDKFRYAMDGILTNVATRYSLSPIGSKTGGLSEALDAQSVVIDSNKQRIAGAVMNWRLMDNITSRSAIRAARKVKTQLKRYPYQTPNGELSIVGYWAFLDQGFVHWRTKKLIKGREFILDAKGQYHREDQELLDELPQFLTDLVDDLNSTTRSVLK